MIDHNAVLLALRARATPLSVVTTGSTTLSATATGYARAAGSFLTDGFAVGMEVTPTGFGVNVVDYLTAVAALTLTTNLGCTVDAAAAGRTLAVKLPALRAWENVALNPVAGRWYIEEDFVPATTELRAGPRSLGFVEETGLYVLRLFGIANTGTLALSKTATALLALYPPGDGQTLSDGSLLRIRGDIGPWRGQIRQDSPGFAVLPVTIPWRCFVNNPA